MYSFGNLLGKSEATADCFLHFSDNANDFAYDC